MPIYGYRCVRCGHQFEVLQTMSDAPRTACPECGGQLHQLHYPVGLIFKGKGFYSTDYRATADGSSEASSDGAAESKPAAKEPAKKKPKAAEKAKPAGD
ncbi:MAG TPA: FmdB family zinc ribbon protein [Candidatus Acidoferrales bacterium]|nr:FmdB family zinc ribbon protein [Candidatus Acidoferrales bacterium]